MKPVTGITTFSGTVPPWKLSLLDNNDTQMSNALNDFGTYSNYLRDVGTVNSLQIVIPTGLTCNVVEGLTLQIKVNNTNTGSVSITVPAQGTFQVTTQNGSQLQPAAIVANGIYEIYYDGVKFQVMGGIFGSALAAGVYDPTVLAGQIQYTGPGNVLAAAGQFWVGLQWPNASGIPSPGIFIGGAGQNQAVFITDEQIPGQKGITIIREAGDASPIAPANNDGGDLLDFAGGSINGNGGKYNAQGGTSVNQIAGDATLAGGNATGTALTAQAGNAVVSSGQVGKKVGIGVILSANTPPGATGTAVIRHQFGLSSTVLSIDEFPDGSEFLYDIPGHPTRGGFGLAGQAKVSGGPGQPTKWLVGFTGSTVIGGQTYTWQSGILISVV